MQKRVVRFWTKDPWSLQLLVVLLILLVFFSLLRFDDFLSPRTWTSMAVQFPEFGIMSLGVMVAMLTAGIDLSVVAIANVTGICTALTLRSVLTPEVSVTNSLMATGIALGIALVVGTICGTINGLLIAKLKIPAILATLGTLELFGGIAIVLTGGKPVTRMPNSYGAVFAAKLFGFVPMPLIIFIICALAAGALLALTGFGKEILMLGTNETAARFSGMKITSLLVRTYVMSGILAAMAGLVMLGNYNSAKADYGATYTLLTVLIVVLGGVNPNGGKGRLMGVILSILILQTLSSGLNTFASISNFYRSLIWGAVLLFVITVNEIDTEGLRARIPQGRKKS